MGLCFSTSSEARYSVPDAKALNDSPQEEKVAERTTEEVKLVNQEPVALSPGSESVPVGAPPTELIGNLIDPIDGPACGLPYKVHYLGPPRPPCEAERLATVKAIGRIDDPEEDPEILNILKLCSSIFQAPVTLCALFDEKRVYISEQDGGVVPRGEFPWRWTLCGWSMAFKNPQILVIPDALQDARFAHNLKVTKPPHIRFYCGAPLIASNGHRLGTLCFTDVKPRAWDAGSCMIMNNLSELVVRQLEKGIALKAKSKDNKALASTYGHLQRALDAFDHCVVLIDTRAPEGWKVVYANAALGRLTGFKQDEVVGRKLDDLFENSLGQPLQGEKLLVDAVAENKACCIRTARTKKGAATVISSGSPPPASLTLNFRPASKNALDDNVMPIGIPSFLQVKSGSDDDHAAAFYFMTIDPTNTKESTKSIALNSCLSSVLNSPAQLEGLDVGHLLGKGTFGSVYYATWFDAPVAVKIIESDASKVRKALSWLVSKIGPMLEALLSTELKHPLVVATLKHFHRVSTPVTTMISSSNISDTTGTHVTTGGSVCGGGGSKLDMVSEDLSSSGQGTNASIVSPLSNNDSSSWKKKTSSNGAPPSAASNAHSSQQWAVIDFAQMAVYDGGEGEEDAAATKVMAYQRGSVDCEASVDITSSIGLSPEAAARRAAGDGPEGLMLRLEEKRWRQTWMIMEYCDRGSLQDVIDRGQFYLDRSDIDKGPKMEAVLATAAEMAQALKFLHSANVVHGDLSGWNIMLSSNGNTANLGGRNFVAKVADFGLARTLELGAEIMTKNYGTLTHMPPETLTQGVVGFGTDIYSFGVLLWQMYTGSRPWSGLSHAQIVMQVGRDGAKLKWPKATPEEYRSLAEACMAREASSRPSFETILSKVQGMQGMLAEGRLVAGNLVGEWD